MYIHIKYYLQFRQLQPYKSISETLRILKDRSRCLDLIIIYTFSPIRLSLMLEGQFIHVVDEKYAFSKFTLLNSQESFLW